jgi:hypothetical protein
MGVFIGCAARVRTPPETRPSTGDPAMSKNLDRKKEGKKKPVKTLKEKRALKEQKRSTR